MKHAARYFIMSKSCLFVLTFLLLFICNTIGAAAPAQTGYIQVDSEPGILIYLDGAFKGITTDTIGGLIIQDVSEGEHRIRVEKPEVTNYEDTVTVVAGQVLVYQVKGAESQIKVEQIGDQARWNVSDGVGTIVIQSIPVQCEVIVEAQGFHQQKTHDLLRMSNVPVGEHFLCFKGGEKILEHTIELGQDETVELMVNFVDGHVYQKGEDVDNGQECADILVVAGIQFRKALAGRFMLGSPNSEQDRYDDEGRRIRVVIPEDFWIGIYPVTQAQWHAVMGANPSKFVGKEHLPVENVSWNDCKEFIEKLNASGEGTFRLPTEAEWEYACRGGSNTRFYWGDDPEYADIDAFAWHDDNSGETTQPVGQKKPNSWGLYDMCGNVWEWCEDDWHESHSGAPRDGSARINSPRSVARVVRGGSWNSNAKNCRSSARLIDDANHRVSVTGLRLVFIPNQGA